MGIVTIGDNEHSIFGDAASANIYLEASPWAIAWEEAAADATDPWRRERALVSASRQLSDVVWKGSPALPVDPRPTPAVGTQPLAFPRTGMTDCEGVAIADGTPASIEIATYVLAAMSIDDAEAFVPEADDGGIRRIEAGSVKIEYFGPGGATLSGLPPSVLAPLACLIAGAAISDSAAGEVIGNDGCFAFDEDDEYHLTGPL